MKKLKLNVELLRVQSFDIGGGGLTLGEIASTQPSACCGTGCTDQPCGTVEALGDTDDCASKRADTMCEPPPSGQQGCFQGTMRSQCCIDSYGNEAC